MTRQVTGGSCVGHVVGYDAYIVEAEVKRGAVLLICIKAAIEEVKALQANLQFACVSNLEVLEDA